MIKYYEELEKPNDFVLPLVEHRSEVGHVKIDGRDLPPQFFDKYHHLLRLINSIDIFIRSINLENLHLRLNCKNYFDENGNLKTDDWQSDNVILHELEEMRNDMPRLIDLKSPIEITYILKFYNKVLYYIVSLCPEFENDWGKILQLFSQAFKDIETYSNIEYKRSGSIPRDVKTPNAWYITPYGRLYNTGGEDGHKEGNLKYPYWRIQDAIKCGISLVGIEKELLQAQQEIIKKGFVEEWEYKSQYKCGYSYSFPEIEILKKYCYEDYPVSKAYMPQFSTILLGILSAKAGLFNFFEDMQKSTNKPQKELEKLKSITNYTLSDVLVRCAGFYKIESVINKTITTSSFTPFQDLQEYLIRGWNVCVIPPIIINREKKVIEELNFSSIIVERQLEKDIKKYEKCKQKGYGRIY